MNGLLVIDKPPGMTSRDVVNRVQRWFPRKTKIGHTGTLDPLATGVLVVCVGAATRLADYVQAMGKSYASRFRLGATSTTDDADGAGGHRNAERARSDARADRRGTRAIRREHRAVTPGGLRAEARRPARHRPSRGAPGEGRADSLRHESAIDAIRVTGYEWPWLDVEVDCGKGTYIRSIARDLGAALGCGGLVHALRRTRVGPFTAEQGIGLETPPDEAQGHLRPMASAVAALSRVRLDATEASRFAKGQVVTCCVEQWKGSGQVGVFSASGELIGIGLSVGEFPSMIRPVMSFVR